MFTKYKVYEVLNMPEWCATFSSWIDAIEYCAEKSYECKTTFEIHGRGIKATFTDGKRID